VFLCVCVCLCAHKHKHTKTQTTPSLPVDLEVFDPARGLVPSRHPSFWASGRPTRGLVGFVFVWSEIFQEGRFDHAFRCALESHATTMPPACSIHDRMRWVRSCGRVRSGRSPRQSPVPPRPASTRRFRISILARQRLRSSALPLASDVHRGLGYPTSPASSVVVSVVAI
jgi:hypothetical protein